MQKTGFTIEIQGVEKYLSDFESLKQSYLDNLAALKKMEQGTSEFYKQQKVVAELKNGVDDFNKALKQQQTILKDMPKGSLKDLNKEYKEQLELLKELEIGSEAYNEQLEVVGKLKNDIKQFNKALSDQSKEFENIDKGVSAYKELEAETRKLKNESKELAAQLVKLAKAGKENTDEYKDLEKQYQDTTKKAQDYDKTLKDIDETVGDSFRNVGNYKDAFRDAFDVAGLGVGGLDDKMKMLAKNPFLLLIAVVVGAVIKLGEAFKKSSKGTDVFRKGAALIEGIMNSLVSVSVQVFEWFEKIFTNNQETISKFGKIIEEQVLNRIYGLIDGFGGLAKVVKKLFERDFDGARKAANETGEAFKNMFTGEENIDGVKGKINDLTESLAENNAATLALSNLRKQAAASNRALQTSLQDVLDKEVELQAMADDTSKGIDAQIQAQKDLLEVQRQKAKWQVIIL